MNVDTMRKIDFYIGVPLAFLSTFILKVFYLFQKKDEKPKNILLIELSEMGSAILVDPAMRKLKNEYKANIHFLIFKKNKPSLDLLKTVQDKNIFTLRSDNLFGLIFDTLKFLIWCRKKKIDAVIDLELFSRFTALLTGYSGAHHRCGFHSFHNEGLYRGEMLTHKVAYNPHIHISKNFLSLVDSLYREKERPYTKRIIPDEEITLAKANISLENKQKVLEKISEKFTAFNPKKNKIVLINSNASDLLPQRRWAKENFAELIQMLIKKDETTIFLLTGSPDEYVGVKELEKMVNNKRCINFAGEVKFSELTALYSLSQYMITNDSGPAHFASVTDMHTFVIFGPETPALYGSLGSTTPIYAQLACSPCVSASNHRKTPCTDNQCIKVITPEDIYHSINQIF